MGPRLRLALVGAAASAIAACGTLLDASDDTPNPVPAEAAASDSSSGDALVASEGSPTDAPSADAPGDAKDAAPDCSGVDFQTSYFHCGSCGHLCNSRHCSAGVCDPLVFVSSMAHNGNFTGATGADTLCRTLATSQAFARPDHFYAWLADGSGPFARGLKLGVRPLWRPLGLVMIAARPSALMAGILLQPIAVDEKGTNATGLVWTNLTEDGTASSGSCGMWTATGTAGATGDPNSTTAAWAQTIGPPVITSCLEPHQIYCFESTEP